MPVLKIKTDKGWEEIAGGFNGPINGGDADTLDGKHASDFAQASDVTDLKALVGDTNVSEQINAAVEAIDFDAIELITIEDIDTICGGTIRAASEVLY